jgi:hypothetical protein
MDPVHLCATGELLPLDKEEDGHTRGHLFCFSLLSFSLFHLFTANITRALPLGTIKGEAGEHTDGSIKGEQRTPLAKAPLTHTLIDHLS